MGSGRASWSATDLSTNMKTQKLILIALCLGACLWSAKIIVGVVGLARVQGSPGLVGWLEVGAFCGAGLLPLLLIRNSGAKHKPVLVGIWVPCIAYVTLLALNFMRLGLVTAGAIRLALWIAIAVLLVRTRSLWCKNA